MVFILSYYWICWFFVCVIFFDYVLKSQQQTDGQHSRYRQVCFLHAYLDVYAVTTLFAN